MALSVLYLHLQYRRLQKEIAPNLTLEILSLFYVKMIFINKVISYIIIMPKT